MEGFDDVWARILDGHILDFTDELIDNAMKMRPSKQNT